MVDVIVSAEFLEGLIVFCDSEVYFFFDSMEERGVSDAAEFLTKILRNFLRT